MNILSSRYVLILLLAPLAGCGSRDDVAQQESAQESAPASAPATETAATVEGAAAADQRPAAEVFFERLAQLCGQAFAGEVVADTPPSADDPFGGKPLVMHVRECSDESIRIPFHVGDDRSRTWVLTRTGGGLRLKHDHRHADGSADAVTMYGGDIADSGTAERQQFPADAESQETFRANDLSASVTNVWALELVPGQLFAYELARPGRLFRVDFDLRQPVDAPPAPWGASADAAAP